MSSVIDLYDRITGLLSGRVFEGLALLFARLALAAQFWISGRTKVEEGSWLQIKEVQYLIFENEFSGLPISPDLAVPMTVYAEFFLPILLAIGLATRFAAAGLLVMTLVIQFFVFPDAWWSVHIMWTALAAILIARGAGIFSIDHIAGLARQK
ncbi:MAG: DoxX family protein [Erythrobacter sp.]